MLSANEDHVEEYTLTSHAQEVPHQVHSDQPGLDRL
jgi:hypothetical protein